MKACESPSLIQNSPEKTRKQVLSSDFKIEQISKIKLFISNFKLIGLMCTGGTMLSELLAVLQRKSLGLKLPIYLKVHISILMARYTLHTPYCSAQISKLKIAKSQPTRFDETSNHKTSYTKLAVMQRTYYVAHIDLITI